MYFVTTTFNFARLVYYWIEWENLRGAQTFQRNCQYTHGIGWNRTSHKHGQLSAGINPRIGGQVTFAHYQYAAQPPKPTGKILVL